MIRLHKLHTNILLDKADPNELAISENNFWELTTT